MKPFFTLLSIFATFLITSYLYIDNFSVNVIGLTQELLILFMAISLILFIKNSKIKTILTTTVLLAYYLVFITQIVSIKITGTSLNTASIANAGQFMLLLNSTMLLNIVLFTAIFIALFKLLTITIKNITLFKNISLLIVILSSYVWLLQYKHKLGKITTFMPAKEFYEVANLFYSLGNSKAITLNKTDIKIAKEFNININLDRKKPLKRDYLYKNNFPYKQINSQKPNVIIFFIESLSARLLSPYNTNIKGVTPNINSFAKESMVIDGYYNHATPTAPALYGQHCSLFPLLTYNDFNKDNNPLKPLDLKCIPQYFNKANYKTVYLSHSRETYSHIEENLKLWGYKELYMWKNLLKKLLPKDKELILGETGLSDHQMMRAVVNYLKNSSNKEPFFMGISTIESHVGFEPNSVDGLKYKDGSSNTLNMIYNLDDSFGIFWNYFKRSKYYKNTIVVLTGDHALYPNVDYKKVASKDWVPSVYDKLSLIIYDPIHKHPAKFTTNSSSVDLAPTLAHLAHLAKDQENSFLGTSIFDNKEYNSSFGISAYPDFNFYISQNNRVTNKKLKEHNSKNILQKYNSLKKLMIYSKYLQKSGNF
jgi:phosphoglycerol transferase MdoB-like AlkP superfamily enzyme